MSEAEKTNAGDKERDGRKRFGEAGMSRCDAELEIRDGMWKDDEAVRPSQSCGAVG